MEPLTIEEIFHTYLPATLYASHYELARSYGHTPQEWRKFIRDNHIFIETELAAIAEAEARSALARLGTASGQEVSALKAILEKSKLINDAQRQNTKVVLTFIPPTLPKGETLHDPILPESPAPVYTDPGDTNSEGPFEIPKPF
jgi:hypothetical protein